MKKQLFLIFIIFISACSQKSEKKTNSKNQKETKQKLSSSELKKNISNFEDTLILLSNKNEIQNIHYIEYFNRLIEFYETYPNLDFAQDCLFKVFSTNTGYSVGHKKHLDIQEKYGDTLLKKYPNYSNKKQLLEGLISNIDLNPNVRDTSKMRHYYNILLKCEGLNDSYILETKKRMKRLDLNIIEYANITNK
tara:strand:+ start:435 stop:1013 length:579 start_codon:yes stop_codon:yes gene_type:complete